MYLSIGSLRYTAGYIINLSTSDKQNAPEALIEKLKTVSMKTNSKDDIVVDGNTNIMYTLAKCCKPVKGDNIVGYITKGDGVTVHKINCPNVVDFGDRTINVEWNYDSDNSYLTELVVKTSNKDFLMDLITESTKSHILISEIKNKENGIDNIYNLLIKVKNKDELELFKTNLRKYKDIRIEED